MFELPVPIRLTVSVLAVPVAVPTLPTRLIPVPDCSTIVGAVTVSPVPVPTFKVPVAFRLKKFPTVEVPVRVTAPVFLMNALPPPFMFMDVALKVLVLVKKINAPPVLTVRPVPAAV